MATLLGWKDILRPIRDGYRHYFPVPDSGPTPEERHKQRNLDQLKGFTYFDTFEQLDTWSEAESSPIQRANTPLLRRHLTDTEDHLDKAAILLVHDYAGNYHDYECIRNIGVGAELYACEYLQYVDTFVYFSHKLLCVPPPTWINALHRNGVRALGTLLIEPQTEGSERLLQHTVGINGLVFPAVKKLIRIAEHYGFDGWLVNIEKPFPKADWDLNILLDFLRQLKGELKEDMRLIWYDALTVSNKVAYQNTLNEVNLPLAEATGGILTNYCWTEKHAETALQSALDQENNILPCQIFFGIDVWAQNTTKLGHPRVTYPEFGGGGTKTGVAVAKLAGLGLSAGIFAPAWSFEHFPGHGRDVERAVWEGNSLPEDLSCSCGNGKTRHQPNQLFSINKHARLFAAGSDKFFYTDFSRAFGKHNDEQKSTSNGHGMHAQLGAQSILPCRLAPTNDHQGLDFSWRLEDLPNRTQLVIEAHHDLRTMHQDIAYRLPLYKLNMLANGSLQLRLSFRTLSAATVVPDISLYVRTTGGIQDFPLPTANGIQSFRTILGTLTSNDRVQDLGIQLLGSIDMKEGSRRILEIMEVCISPRSSLRTPGSCSIHSAHMDLRGDSSVVIGWAYSDADSAKSSVDGMQYSDITGPFAYFRVRVDGLSLGRAYGLETVVSEALLDPSESRKYHLEVEGIGFDGRTLAESSMVSIYLPQ